jgi:hypothetical protein
MKLRFRRWLRTMMALTLSETSAASAADRHKRPIIVLGIVGKLGVAGRA